MDTIYLFEPPYCYMLRQHSYTNTPVPFLIALCKVPFLTAMCKDLFVSEGPRLGRRIMHGSGVFNVTMHMPGVEVLLPLFAHTQVTEVVARKHAHGGEMLLIQTVVGCCCQQARRRRRDVVTPRHVHRRRALQPQG